MLGSVLNEAENPATSSANPFLQSQEWRLPPPVQVNGIDSSGESMSLASSSAGLLHRSPVVAFHVSFPSQPLLVVHNNLEEELKNPFLSLRMNPFAPKALMRTVAFADVFLLNNKLYKIPSNLSICQNPLFFVPHPQRHYHCSLPVITQL